MKPTRSLPLLLLSLATQVPAALTTNLVAYYDFQETGTAGLANKAPGATGFDASWSAGSFSSGGGPGFAGNAAFNPGDGLSNRSTTLVGNSLNIVDLANQFMTAPIGSADLGNTFTISAWTYLAPGASNTSARFHAFETGDSGVFDVSWGTTGTYSTTGRDDYLGYVESTVSSTISSLVENQWQHVAMVYSRNGSNNPVVSIYINGSTTPVTATDTSGTFAFTSLIFGDARLGRADDRNWDGMIDEIAIWNRALTGAELTEVYDLGTSGQAVPEPAAVSMLGILGTCLLFRRRRP